MKSSLKTSLIKFTRSSQRARVRSSTPARCFRTVNHRLQTTNAASPARVSRPLAPDRRARVLARDPGRSVSHLILERWSTDASVWRLW